MKRTTTFAAFAVFVFLAGSSTAISEQGNDTGPVRLNAPRGQAPVPVVKPVQENQIPKQFRSAPALLLPTHLLGIRVRTSEAMKWS